MPRPPSFPVPAGVLAAAALESLEAPRAGVPVLDRLLGARRGAEGGDGPVGRPIIHRPRPRQDSGAP